MPPSRTTTGPSIHPSTRVPGPGRPLVIGICRPSTGITAQRPHRPPPRSRRRRPSLSSRRPLRPRRLKSPRRLLRPLPREMRARPRVLRSIREGRPTRPGGSAPHPGIEPPAPRPVPSSARARAIARHRFRAKSHRDQCRARHWRFVYLSVIWLSCRDRYKILSSREDGILIAGARNHEHTSYDLPGVDSSHHRGTGFWRPWALCALNATGRNLEGRSSHSPARC